MKYSLSQKNMNPPLLGIQSKENKDSLKHERTYALDEYARLFCWSPDNEKDKQARSERLDRYKKILERFGVSKEDIDVAVNKKRKENSKNLVEVMRTNDRVSSVLSK